MNPFVNVKKRSISLPPGCKDLADVLKARARRIAKLDTLIAWRQSATITPVRYERTGLIHVQEHVAEVISALTTQPSLHIRTLDGLRGVTLYCDAGELNVVPLPDTAERTKRIEEFFATRGIKANIDRAVGEDGAGGILRVLIFLLARDVSAVTVLITGLLRAVYDVADEMGLEFTAVAAK